MGYTIALIVIGGYLLLSIILLPFQYNYIKSIKEQELERKRLGLTINEHYEDMSFETQQLHYNAQGNPLFIGANILASILYKLKNKK